MFEYVRGMLSSKNPGSVTIEAGGVGYGIAIPLSTYEKLPALESEVKILTHYHVREDVHQLFGFLTEPERSTFRQLIGISNIGPKVAMNVLSGASVAELNLAVNSGDATRLRSIPGVGPKTAERILMELRGKLSVIADSGSASTASTGAAPRDGIKREAYEAMLALGYAEKQVSSAISRVASVIEPNALVEEWIRKALQVI